MKRTISVHVSDWRRYSYIFYKGTGVIEQFKIRFSEIINLEILGLEKKIPCEIQLLDASINGKYDYSYYLSVQIEDEVVTNFSVKSYAGIEYTDFFIKNPKHSIFRLGHYNDCGQARR